MKAKAFRGLRAVALAAVLVLVSATWAAAQRSALDEERAGPRPRPEAVGRPREMDTPAAREARAAEMPRRAEPGRPADEVRPVVLQFKNIPAESFLRTLKQLSEHPALGGRLREIPMSLNEEANAVVVIGPPHVVAYLTAIARGLDQPSEFGERARQRERMERAERLRMETGRRGPAAPAPPRGPRERAAMPAPPAGPGARCPMCGRMMEPAARPPMGMRAPPPEMAAPPRPEPRALRPEPPRPEPRAVRPEPPRPEPRAVRPEPPRPEPARPEAVRPEPARPEAVRPEPAPAQRPLSMLTTPRAAEELGLSEKQVRAIREILEEAAEPMADLWQKVREKVRDLPPEERATKMRELYRDVSERRAEAMREVREKVLRILTPEQRERARRLLGDLPPAPAPEPRERPGAAPPRRPEGRPGASDAPVIEEHPARFRLVQDVTEEQRPVRVRATAITIASDGQSVTIASDGGGPVVLEGARGASIAVAGTGEGTTTTVTPREGRPMRFFGGGLGSEGEGALRMLRDEKVLAEVNLTETQAAIIGDLQKQADELQAQTRAGWRARPEEGAPEGLTPEERRARMQETFRARMDAFQKVQEELAELDKSAYQTLTEPQREKLIAISRERTRQGPWGTGPWALLREDAVKELSLSTEQVEKIRTILGESAREAGRIIMERAQGLADLPPEERRAKMRELWAEAAGLRDQMMEATNQRIMEVLTPEQQKGAGKFIIAPEPGRGEAVTRTVRRPQEGETAPEPAPTPKEGPAPPAP